MVKVVDAKFLTSSTSKENALAPDISEIVFLGRSNVGKSSLINSLTNRKNLAKSSNTPGKTRLINFFEVVYKTIEDSHEESLKYILRFVDLPGFGYAKVSKEEQKKWEKHLTQFLESRFNIRIYLHLIDSRHPNLEIDFIMREFLNSIVRADQQVVNVFTKSDKLNQKELSEVKRVYPNSIFVSNLKNKGIDSLNEKIFTTVFKVNPNS